MENDHSKGHHRSSFLVGTEDFHFAIDERIKRTDHVETPEEKSAKGKAAKARNKRDPDWSLVWYPSPPKWDFVSTGELLLTVYGPSQTGIPDKFRDTSTSTLETRVNEVMVCIRRMAAVGAAKRHERELHERERRAEAAKAAEEHVKREAERARKSALLRDATAWRQAEDIRAYVNHAEREVRLSGDEGDDDTLEAWSEWALACADEIDPLKLRPWCAKVASSD